MPRKVFKLSEERHAAQLAAKARWRKRNPDNDINRLRFIRYGISAAEYAKRFAEQGGVCAICHRPETTRHTKTSRLSSLCVDHDHFTGEVRALLCRACNQAVGLFRDNEDYLLSAAAYIGKYRGLNVRKNAEEGFDRTGPGDVGESDVAARLEDHASHV